MSETIQLGDLVEHVRHKRAGLRELWRIADIYRHSTTSTVFCTAQLLQNGRVLNYPCWMWAVVLCEDCGYGRSAHTEEGQCFYAPTRWRAPE